MPWAITFAVNNSTRVPVNETSKNRGLEKLRSGTIRGEEEIARRVIRNWIPLDNIQAELGQVSRNSNLEDSNNY